MTLSTFLFTYLLGGLTFIPLLLAAILVPAWRTLPEVGNGIREGGDEKKNKDAEKKDGASGLVPEEKSEGAASGTFAVLRRYDFQAAIAALNMRNNTGTGAGASSVDGTGEISSTSESVYQSMYRSVFDRNKNVTSTTSIMESEDVSSSPANVRARKGVTPVNVFYIVLRHGHLMLYDSAAQMEVRHVISLAHHTISVSSGGGYQEADMKDGDVFIKRTAIVLTPTSTDNLTNEGGGGGHLLSSAPKKPFFLFSPTCVEKEDFYHALLSTRTTPPIPRPLDTDGIIKLQSTLHSTNSLTPETRALNAIISRLFLALHHTDRLKTIVRNKIEKKISRVQKPAFIASLAVQSVDLGDSAPVVSNPRLKDLNISGDMTIAFDVRYTGGIKVTVSALAKLDLGTRFKTRTADLLLSISLSRLQGHVLVRIKPPPSNRLWFCFESMPEMEIKVEPVVQSRQITYTFILRAIEERIRSVVGETLVKPNWDDAAFFDTRGQSVRGGIWLKDEEVVEEKPAGEVLKESNEKTRSMPSVLASGGVDGDSSAASSGSEMTSTLTSAASAAAKEAKSELKRRSVASLPAERELQTPPPLPPKPLRSPSLASPSASVASVQLDESPANFEPVRSDSQPQVPQQKKWRIRPASQQQTARKDAMETMREMRDRSTLDREAEDEFDGAVLSEPAEIEDSELFSTDRSLRQPKRTQTNVSTMTSSSSTSTRSQRQQEAMQKGKNLLAATAAATNVARNWSWNAIQNRTKGSRGAAGQPQQEPVGRGRPLPPPGVPLPGPQKGWLPSGVGMGSVKRKPVPPLPARTSTVETQEANENTAEQVNVEGFDNDQQEPNDGLTGDANEGVASPTSDEFGPWRENSGAGLEELEGDITKEVMDPASVEDERSEGEADLFVTEPGIPSESTPMDLTREVVETVVKKKVPPPLPARPRLEEHGEDHVEKSDDVRTSETIQKGDKYVSASALAPTASAQMGTVPQAPAHVEDLRGYDSESEADSRIADADTEDLVAIPAPVDENADETELEAEGVQEVSEIDTSQQENKQLKEYLQTSGLKDMDEASAGTSPETTTAEHAADGR